VLHLKTGEPKPGQTLEATALVHEAYLRLVGTGGPQHWQGRYQFLAAAAKAMRHILVDNARRKRRAKHGGGRQRLALNEAVPAPPTAGDELLALDEALTRLATEDPEAAGVVQLRYFAGLSVEEAARSLGISRASAYRHWNFARAWLLQELSGDESA
jgi:RNA polymerase sigma factor (TIGR02999 family)